VDGDDTSGLAAAVAAARGADVVVLGLGLTQHIESESHDRTEVDLPAIQVRKPPSWPRSWANFSLF
jgi:hypothetical protein